ncbi:MAG: acetyl-CoA C-acyltransferase [Acidobacteria bacterium]|nr:acetyl-CoA C-acyltransferase [Acidobacteriota bacterium]
MAKREAVVVATARTALAKSFRGSLNLTRPEDMIAHCIRAVIERVPGVSTDELATRIEDVVIGCGYPGGVQGMNIARVASLLAGLPVEVAGATVNRFCSSGLQAVAMAAWQIINEGAEVAIGGGVESITMLNADRVPHPEVNSRYPGVYMVMGETAELVAKRYGVSREQQDAYALLSQQRTAQAQAAGLMKEEIASMAVTRAILDRQSGEPIAQESAQLDQDECNRPATTLEGLSGLKPHFDQNSGQGTVTAGNSSAISDGAAALLVMSAARAKALGLSPMAKVRSVAAAGCDPSIMGYGPVPAVQKALKLAGLQSTDIDLWELNEAFAAQSLPVLKDLGLWSVMEDKVNQNGGAIALGHPLGCSGARISGTLVHLMRNRKARLGVSTMCIGMGQGVATVFEAV